jgi:hypothetical protein
VDYDSHIPIFRIFGDEGFNQKMIKNILSIEEAKNMSLALMGKDFIILDKHV